MVLRQHDTNTGINNVYKMHDQIVMTSLVSGMEV